MNEHEIDNRIAAINSELLKLKQQKSQIEDMSPAEKIAIELHGMLCHSNHIDACGWDYEIDDGIHQWDRATHKPYLHKAGKVIKFANNNKISISDLIKFTKMIKGL